MISLKLGPILAARGIQRPFTFLVRSGFTRHKAEQLLHDSAANIRFSDIEKLCLLFHCTPNDLLLWTPPPNTIIPSSHPLHALRKEGADYSWMESLRQLPLDEVSKLSAELRTRLNPGTTEE